MFAFWKGSSKPKFKVSNGIFKVRLASGSYLSAYVDDIHSVVTMEDGSCGLVVCSNGTFCTVGLDKEIISTEVVNRVSKRARQEALTARAVMDGLLTLAMEAATLPEWDPWRKEIESRITETTNAL